MDVRRATSADAAVLAELERACFADPWSERAIADDLSEGLARAWVAEDAGAACGYVLATQVVDELTIARIASVPSARRRGTGRALLTHAVAKAREEGVTVVFLEVRVGNTAATGLYASAGFAVTRRRKAYYADGEDALDMRWDLT